jgi:hypothetical protein
VQAAQRDAGHDRGTAGELHPAQRLAEQHRAGRRPDERLEVHERARDVRGHPALAVSEQRERRHGAAQHEPGGCQQRA